MTIKEILNNNKVIAVVGFSENHTRPSNRIGRYLDGNGYTVYGVNPKLSGTETDNIKCYSNVKDLPEQADIINIFRRSEFVEDLIKEILEMNYKPKVIWAQIGVISSEGRSLAEDNEIAYIENKCIMIEHSKIWI